MIPRGQIDIGWVDLAVGLLRCAWPGGRWRIQQELERLWDADGRAVATLSVRSGLDLVLRALALPPGSEVLVSAITIRDMVTILEAHELVVVPVPVEMDRLAVSADALAAAVTPRTRAVLVAHLFGSRMPMDPIVSFARARGLVLLEDCAQAYSGSDYRGADGADVSMFSFGPIKTNTALGGALLRCRDREIASRLRSLQRELPVQRRRAFAARVAKYMGIRTLLHRATFSALTWGCRIAGVSHDQVIARSVRGFAGRELIPALRHQPSYPLLALVRRRLCRFRPEALERRVGIARALREATAHLCAPGDGADPHTHWVVPVWVEDPERVARSLRRCGLDATRGASSLHAIPPRTGEAGAVNRAGPKESGIDSTDPMSSVLYLPFHPALSHRDLARLRLALRGVRSPGRRGVGDRSLRARNPDPPTDSGLSGRPAMGSLASRSWDLVVVGGGITGAAVFREAARRGARVLLVERGDFASGTSSRSSKLVHGGLHYLGRGHLRLALESIRERNRLLRQRRNLVTPIPFAILPGERGTRPGPIALATIIAGYRLLAGSEPRAPNWSNGTGGRAHRYHEAQTDDARMVLQLLLEGVEAGGMAVNYAQVTETARDGSERVVGVRVQDRETGASGVVRARVVVNATGPRAGLLVGPRSAGLRVRGIRGSHLVLSRARLPISHAVGTIRPGTRDWVCFIPWNGVVLVGSTSVDLSGTAPLDPVATEDEVRVLLSDVQRIFPDRGVTLDDVQATFAGVRPVVDTETADPALASREEAIVEADGMITVTGGKLTTHQATAKRVLDRCIRWIPGMREVGIDVPPPEPEPPCVPRTAQDRVRDMVASEGVRHLDDLLLRRLRWGITRPDGGLSDLPSLRRMLEPALGWDDRRWTVETRRYLEELERSYRLPRGMGDGRGLDRAVRAAKHGSGSRFELGRAAAVARSLLAGAALLTVCGFGSGLEAQAPEPAPQAPEPAPERQIMALPFLNFDADEGLGYGVLGSLILPVDGRTSEGAAPFRLRMDPTLQLTTGGRRELSLFVDVPRPRGSHWRLTVNALLERRLAVPYYGRGNASAHDPALEEEHGAFYRFGRKGWRARISARRSILVGPLSLMVGAEAAGTVVTPVPSGASTTFLAQELSTGTELPIARTRSLAAGLVWDSRSHETVPTRGTWAELLVQRSAEALGSDTDFTRWTFALRRYQPIAEGWTLAGRFLLQEARGEIPVHEVTRIQSSDRAFEGLGGGKSLRGIPQNRYVGAALAVANAELRWEGGPRSLLSLNGRPGLVGFVDAGQVWDPPAPWTSRSLAPHVSVGAGARIRMGEHFLVSADVGHSSHSSVSFYLGVGHLF